MAHDYPLEELSHRAFEQLSVALALRVLGPGVEAFGAGRDGGREATFRGLVDWSNTDLNDPGRWDGYVVIQAKQAEQPPKDPGASLRWLTSQVDAELDAWMSHASKREEFPRYLIFVTNVRLSSVPSSGIDAINRHIRNRLRAPWLGDAQDTLQARGLRDWRVWHRDQLNMLITADHGVRQAFKGLLTVGDLLAALGELTGLLDPEQFAPVLTAHATRTLGTERWVSFREAGGATRESVENIFVDLRVGSSTSSERRDGQVDTTILEEVFRRSDLVLKPSMLDKSRPRHIVLTGQAGSGKSTVTRFLTQAFRCRFAVGEVLTETESEVVRSTAEALQRIGVASPKGRRWPVRVNLAEFADAVGPDGGIDLLRWISARVSERAGLDVKPHALKRWLTHWPCVVIFDGLDEVTAPEVRPRVLDEITQFVEEAEKDDADLLAVVTTRPTGYAEQLMPAQFQQFDLAYLDGAEAIDYGRLVTMRRLSDDLDRRDQLIRTFEKQIKVPAMLRLMKTPLQVLIMTIILERAGVLPADRYQLFSRYFDTIYERESSKNTNLAPLLAQHRAVIVDLHEAAGLRLQVQSEASGDARAVLPTAELRSLLEQRLRDLEYAPGLQLERVTDQIMQATTERLVLLVPVEDDCVAFEIRSLQELMAARALVGAPDPALRARLSISARSPHWRNTWVFIAGSVFANGADYRRELVIDVVESIDRDTTWAGWLAPAGPELAGALLDDGLAIPSPKWHRRLIDVALRAIAGPVPADLRGIAAGLTTAAAADSATQMRIRNALKQALAGTPQASVAALFLLVHSRLADGMPQDLLRGVEPGGAEKPDPVSVGGALRAALATVPHDAPARRTLQPVFALMDRVEVPGYGSREVGIFGSGRLASWDGDFVASIDHELSGALLELLVGALDPREWRVGYGLGIVYSSSASRKPIGDFLAAVGTS